MLGPSSNDSNPPDIRTKFRKKHVVPFNMICVEKASFFVDEKQFERLKESKYGEAVGPGAGSVHIKFTVGGQLQTARIN